MHFKIFRLYAGNHAEMVTVMVIELGRSVARLDTLDGQSKP